jgi:hypothetical protein
VFSRLVVLRNVLKAWALLVGACAIFALIGWGLGGYRLLSIFVFCGALLAGALYWYSDRVALGLVRARELPVGASPAHTRASSALPRSRGSRSRAST